MPTANNTRAPKRIYELQIELAHIEPRIWRTILVPDNLKLSKLDLIIQTAFGWSNSHLHEFTIGTKQYGLVEIEKEWSMGLDFGRELLDERKFTLGQTLGDEVQRFVYEYDFGDGWEHIAKVIKIHEPTATNSKPVCVAGKNACPPEDVGGPPGYAYFVEVLADPAHEDYASMLEWVGGEFDPEAFQIDATNAAIKRLR
jgi:hypothetical protein